MTLRVRCLFFARYAEILGTDEATLVLPPDAVVADAVSEVRTSLPGGDRLPPTPMIAVNQTHVLAGQTLNDGDELAFLPPLAGG